MLQLDKKLIALFTLVSLILILGLNANAQVSCVGEKVVCDNGGTPYCYHLFNEINSRPICSVDYNVPPGGKYGPACTHPRDGIKPTKPECLLSAPLLPPGVEFYCDDNGKIICGNGGTPSCASRGPTFKPTCNGLGTVCCTTQLCVGGLQCLQLCDAGYAICPSANNPISCCLYGCCPLDQTKCKCKNSDRCSPNCTDTSTPTYSCDSGLTICPNNTDPNGKCCKYGCCPLDPTKCKCQFSSNCSPNCLRCDAGDTTCPNSDNPKACCKNGCCPSDPNKCKCPSNNQCSPNCTSLPETPETSEPLGCSNNLECKNGYYCNLSFPLTTPSGIVGSCSENPPGCVVGCTTDSQCFGGSTCILNCCTSKETTKPTEPTSPPENTGLLALSADFTGIWKGIIPKNQVKEGEARTITLNICIVDGEIEGFVNQRGVINNGEIISQEVISEREVNIEAVDNNDNILMLNLKLVNSRRLIITLANESGFIVRKSRSKNQCLFQRTLH